MGMAEVAAADIQRRAWSKKRKYICKSACDKICANIFGAKLADKVWSRIDGVLVPRKDVPRDDLEHALKFLGFAKSDEVWMALNEPVPLSEPDYFEVDGFWSCEEQSEDEKRPAKRQRRS